MTILKRGLLHDVLEILQQRFAFRHQVSRPAFKKCLNYNIFFL